MEALAIYFGKKLLKAAYSMGGRSYIKKKIDNPDSEYDEKAMALIDKLIEYEAK